MSRILVIELPVYAEEVFPIQQLAQASEYFDECDRRHCSEYFD